MYRVVRLFIADAKCTLRLVLLSDISIAIFREMLMQLLRNSRVAIHYQYTPVLFRYCSQKRRFDSRKGTFSSRHTPVKLRYGTVQNRYDNVPYCTVPYRYCTVMYYCILAT